MPAGSRLWSVLTACSNNSSGTPAAVRPSKSAGSSQPRSSSSPTRYRHTASSLGSSFNRSSCSSNKKDREPVSWSIRPGSLTASPPLGPGWSASQDT